MKINIYVEKNQWHGIFHKNNKIGRDTFKVGDNIILSNGELKGDF